MVTLAPEEGHCRPSPQAGQKLSTNDAGTRAAGSKPCRVCLPDCRRLRPIATTDDRLSPANRESWRAGSPDGAHGWGTMYVDRHPAAIILVLLVRRKNVPSSPAVRRTARMPDGVAIHYGREEMLQNARWRSSICRVRWTGRQYYTNASSAPQYDKVD